MFAVLYDVGKPVTTLKFSLPLGHPPRSANMRKICDPSFGAELVQNCNSALAVCLMKYAPRETRFA